MGKYSIGLKSLKIGTIAVDGGMGTALTAVDGTVSSTAILQTQAPTITDFFTEEKDNAVFSFASKKTSDTLKFSMFDVSPDNLAVFMGGTVTGTTNKAWNSSDTIVQNERSLELEAQEGFVLSIPRGKVVANLMWNFDKTKLAQIDVQVSILQPTKDGVSAMIVADPITGQPPVANAGADQAIATDFALLDATASTTPVGTITNYQWTKVSGPNTPVITGATEENAAITGLIAGTYVYQVLVTNSFGLTSTDSVSIVKS